MAEDLQRFLDDKPIKARHVTSTERVVRWARRNPAMAALSAGLVRPAARHRRGLHARRRPVPQLADQERQIRREAEAALQREADQRRRTDAALRATEAAETEGSPKPGDVPRRTSRRPSDQQAEAVRQQKIAEANFQLARRAVDDYLTRVSENRLLRVAGLQPLRKELLESALSYYQGFLNQRQGRPVAAERSGAGLFPDRRHHRRDRLQAGGRDAPRQGPGDPQDAPGGRPRRTRP